MAEIVQSLFGVTPEAYQQAQSQRGDAMALRYAQLDPFQQANYAIGRGAYGLAGAVGGLLGGQDPELQRITLRQQIASQLNPNDLSTFEKAFNALAPTDPQGAMMVRAELDKVQMGRAKLASENALTGQREQAARASKAQAAKSQSEIDEVASQTMAFAALKGKAPTAAEPIAAQPVVPEPMAAGPNGTDIYGRPYSVDITPVDMRSVAPRTGSDLIGVDLLPAAPVAPAAPIPATQTRATLNQQIDELESRRIKLLALNKIPAAKAEADVLGDRIKELRDQGKPVVVGNTLVNSSNGSVIYQGDKPEKYSAFAQELIDAGLTPGTPPFQKRMLSYISEKEKGAGKGTGNVSVNVGGITVDTGAAAKKAGEIIGTNVANVEQQYSLNTAFKDALTLLDQGIYGGAYGPEKQFVAKYVGVGDPKKVVNTEVFLANIGEIVIPRLQQFGGNDSNEELKYLQKVVAGDQRLEPAAMKQILASAEKKVQKNLARLQQQTEAGKTGGELPIGPVNPAKSSTPTKRYNPKTGKIEAISGE